MCNCHWMIVVRRLDRVPLHSPWDHVGSYSLASNRNGSRDPTFNVALKLIIVKHRHSAQIFIECGVFGTACAKRWFISDRGYFSKGDSLERLGFQLAARDYSPSVSHQVVKSSIALPIAESKARTSGGALRRRRLFLNLTRSRHGG